MKIAIISDIHGNHIALKEVLDEARRNKVEKILVLGDIVGYYYHPDIVLDLLEEWDYELIKGNHEDILYALKEGDIDKKALCKKYGSGHNIALSVLSKERIELLVNAPEQKRVEIMGKVILMCHGSNWNHNTYLYPDTSSELLGKADIEGVDYIFVGHSHYPFVRPNQYSTLVNVGSVGQSRSRGGVACWAILNVESGSVEMKQTNYLVDELEREAELNDPEVEYLKNILRRDNP